jgi:hypothetical protein
MTTVMQVHGQLGLYADLTSVHATTDSASVPASLQGLEAVMAVDGARDGDVCRADVEQGLGPTVQPGAVGMRDNWRAHKVAASGKP